MKIVNASLSGVKLEAAQKALARLKIMTEIINVNAESGVNT